MIEPWITILVAAAYGFVLFTVASLGDRAQVKRGGINRARPNTYALSLAVFCTTWTFFGSVGLAATSGVSFLAVYVGPILMVTLGFPILKRVTRLSKEERITSVSDFMGARYGKNQKVAAVAALIAVIGTVPYIALQLKAISASVNTLLTNFDNGFPSGFGQSGDISILVSIALAIFAILFGTRQADATEHQHGMMLAVALESVIKLMAFLAVGIFVTWYMFDGLGDLYDQAIASSVITEHLRDGFADPTQFVVITILSFSAFLLLPRQFHVAVVENMAEQELNRARWLFPLYLVLINLFVIPIAVAGSLRFGITANPDDYVLLLPLLEEQRMLSLFVFIGGLSAGTAMVVVACIALAIMISNDLVLPVMLRNRALAPSVNSVNMERRILFIRRTAIAGVLLLGYLYYVAADNSAALASIGLVSFTAIAQLAPAFFGGLFWRDANARGAICGMAAGFGVWAYTLLLPTFLPGNHPIVVQGAFGLNFLNPEHLFGLDLSPIANGVLWSLVFNTLAYVTGSLSRTPDSLELLQASIFIQPGKRRRQDPRPERPNVTIAELKAMLSRYLGVTRTQRALEAYWLSREGRLQPSDEKRALVDNALLRHSEQLLASAVGASSSRLIHSLLLKSRHGIEGSDYQLLDEASRAIQFNRDVLQTAFDQLEQGISVFDGDFRLASWNRQFRELLNLPSRMGQAGLRLNEIAQAIVEANDMDEHDPLGNNLAHKLVHLSRSWHMHLPQSGRVLEISTSPMPEGGVVISWNDITERMQAADALKEANETLERRVEERTKALENAMRQADQANASKTRFLAAAGHDLLQPLNAARLYCATLVERSRRNHNSELAENISRSLGSVEEIMASVLAISRLDTANFEARITEFPIAPVLEQMNVEFTPVAQKAGLELVIMPSSVSVRSDATLLRRLLQNLISNAIKFTTSGRVVIGIRRRGSGISLEVHDTGVGICAEDQSKAFLEFSRLSNTNGDVPGLGLGLSIVRRISDLLGHSLSLISEPGKGSCFQIYLPRAVAFANTGDVIAMPKRAPLVSLDGMSVLCLDNEPIILDGMEKLLNQWGCDVFTAQDQTAAEAVIAEHAIDFLCIDYHLDGTTGINVHRELEKRLARRLPATLITADRSDEVTQAAANAGLVMLRKPVKPAALRAVLNQHRIPAEAAE